MIKGEFLDGNKPMIKASVLWGQSIQNPYFVLDTGFTGDLAVTPKIAQELGLEITGKIPTKNAFGKIETVSVATAFAVMEGVTLYVSVLITNGIPLLGISFLRKFNYKAVVDCKNNEVSLNVVI